MYNKIFNVISMYTNLIISNYQAIAKINSSMPILRLIAQKQDKMGKIYFVVQITGKNIFPKFFLNDFQNSSIFVNFSKSDQEIIRRFLPRDQHQVTKYITARTYDLEKKQFIFTIESVDQKSNIRKCVRTDKLSQLLHEVGGFDTEDAFLIGLETSKTELN